MNGIIILVISLLAVVSARQTEQLDLGERVWQALREKGIGEEKLAQILKSNGDQDKVGDIWSNCGSSSDIGKIVNVDIKPDPPQKGKGLTVNAEVTLSKKVINGTVSIKIYLDTFLGKILVTNVEYPLCGTETGLTCPLDEGNISVKIEQEIPSSAPGGHYTGMAVAKDSEGKQIICISLDFHL